MENLLTYTPATQTAISIAQSLAKEQCQGHFGPAHLLKALLHNEVGLASQLSVWGFDIHYLRDWADIRLEEYPKSARPVDEPMGDPQVAVALEVADIVRMKLGQDALSPLAVLIALIKPKVAFSPDQLTSLPLTESGLLALSLQEKVIATAVPGATPGIDRQKASGAKALFDFCADKTELARAGKLDPIVGREKELRAMAEILGRRSKPNVIITGEPGVGKTALVDGFAQNIIAGNVPENLRSALIFEMDTGALIAGASYRGEVEERLKKIIRELKQFDRAILFIDEIHVLLDEKGGFSGAANLLKPELARGELTVIGATTSSEYRKYIESDEAFNRRFEQLKIEEPDEEITLRMISNLLPLFEAHHLIRISPEALQETVRLARRYVKDRQLPDSAIDLLDRTMSAIRLMNETAGEELDQLREGLENTEAREAPLSLKDLRWLHRRMITSLSPVLVGQLEDAAGLLQLKDPGLLRDRLLQMIDQLNLLAKEPKETIEPADVAAVVAYKTGIPVGKIRSDERERLLRMETHLRQRVVGQDQALKVISDTIIESRAGLSKPGQPVGSFFLLGPTGTGKTELAKSLAAFLFDDENALVRFDMSEFKEKHSSELLIGAPPGFVGYEEGGLLVNQIRQKPYSVLLFDEIEKAHPSVFDLFLQIMDEGKLHDRLGKTGDFSNAIVLFTSNIGSDVIIQQHQSGKLPSSQELKDLMKSSFRPEFLNRLTEIVPFSPISEEHMVTILDIQLLSLTKALKSQGIHFQLNDPLKQWLAQSGYSKEYGARPLQGMIRQYLRRPLSRMIMSGELKSGMSAMAGIDDAGEITWKTDAA